MIEKLILIAEYLTTEIQSKGHGSWLRYRDDKIEISYDTYYPNVDVRIKLDNKWEIVVSHSGHGITHVYKSGAWQKYVSENLYSKAVEARRLYDLEQERKKQEQKNKNFGAINDSKIFT